MDSADARKEDEPTSDPSGRLRGELGPLLRQVDESGDYSDQSRAKLLDILDRFERFLAVGHWIDSLSQVTRAHVELFAVAPTSGDPSAEPASATMHLRRSAVRLLFRLARDVGLTVGDPTLDLELPPRARRHVRPLTDAEIIRCRSASLHTSTETRLPAAWAFAEATARTSELPLIVTSDVDLASSRVWIHGASRTEPRHGFLTAWGVQQVRRRLDSPGRVLDEGRPIVYEGDGGGASGQASCCAAIAWTMRRAGLAGDAAVRPTSVAAWAGRRLHDEGVALEDCRPKTWNEKSGPHRRLHRTRSAAGLNKPVGPAALEKVEAILRNPAVYALADLIPESSEAGGRPRSYPNFMVLVYAALTSVWRSARQVEAELAHPVVWTFMRDIVGARFPNEPSRHLPVTPMRRHHFIYMRDRYLTRPAFLGVIGDLHRVLAADQARGTGLLDPDGEGSWTHPSLDRLLHADGKVVTPLFRAKPGDVRIDKETGEIIPLRHEPDAALHFEGDGEAAWGTKFVMVAARGMDARTRFILDVERVEKPGAEASVAMSCFRRLAPLVPGAQGIVYDTALRGVHHQEILRDLGLLSINRVAAAEKGASAPRRKEGRRVAKSAHVEDEVATVSEGQKISVSLYAQDGAIGTGRLTDRGELLFEPLRRFRTHRSRDKTGAYRWYNDYRLPQRLGRGIVTVRLHANDEDTNRRFNRTENVRPIPPSDPDFARLYARRNDAESINRNLEDTLFLGRAHSLGSLRQQVDLIGYALLVNGLSLLRHERRGRLPAAA